MNLVNAILLGSSRSHLRNILLSCIFCFIFLFTIYSSGKTENGIETELADLRLPVQMPGVMDYSDYRGPEQVMAARRSLVTETCVKYAGHGVRKPMNPFYPSRFFPASLTLSESKGLAWCRVGKVGTTAWSVLFLLFQNIPVETIQAAVKNLTAHDLMKQYYPSKPRERMHKVKGEHGQEYFRFMVVRHPFVRLVSAYRDKLETLTEYNVRYHMSDSIKMTGRRVYNESVSDNPTFAEFVDYLIRTPPNLMDKHWAPYSKVCTPCTLPYDAILKLETVGKDADWLFNEANISQYKSDWDALAGINDRHIHVGPGGRPGAEASESIVRKYYAQLKRSDIILLYEKYRVDFEMFGYQSQVEEFIQMGKSEK